MKKNKKKRESLEIQGFGLSESTAMGLGSISGWRTKTHKLHNTGKIVITV